MVSSSFGQGPSEAEGEGAVVEWAQAYPSELVLIVVAGMNYAAKVESQSKDVLTSSEQYAKTNPFCLLTMLTKR